LVPQLSLFISGEVMNRKHVVWHHLSWPQRCKNGAPKQKFTPLIVPCLQKQTVKVGKNQLFTQNSTHISQNLLHLIATGIL
jgi:hypothetical protein